MLTIDQVNESSIEQIMDDARRLPAFKHFRITMENNYYSDRDKWFVSIHAVHEGIEVTIQRFSEINAELLPFVREVYGQFLRTIGYGMPRNAYRPELTYTPKDEDA